MIKTIFKSVVFGIFTGTVIFFAGPFILAIFILKFIFTPFGAGRMMMGHYHHGMRPSLAFAEKIRNMNEEEYAALKTRMNERFHHHCGYRKENETIK